MGFGRREDRGGEFEHPRPMIVQRLFGWRSLTFDDEQPFGICDIVMVAASWVVPVSSTPDFR